MNLLNDVVLVTATYNPTEAGERWTDNVPSAMLYSFAVILWFVVMVAFVFLFFADKMPSQLVKALRIEELKKKIWFDKQVTITMSGAQITTSVMVILLLISACLCVTSFISKDDHLVQNIQQKYAVDDIQWNKDNGIYSLEQNLNVTVTKDAKTYEVIITQNPDTYEPTLLNPKSNKEMTELLK